MNDNILAAGDEKGLAGVLERYLTSDGFTVYKCCTRAEGSELGLAIAKQIITLHKGTASATSKDGLTVFAVTRLFL